MPTTNLPVGVITGIQNFYTLVSNIKSSLTTSHESSDNEAKELVLLRKHPGFACNDPVIESHYDAVQNLDLNQ